MTPIETLLGMAAFVIMVGAIFLIGTIFDRRKKRKQRERAKRWHEARQRSKD